MKLIKNKKGFTLIELIVVMAIIGILVLLAIPKFMGYTEKAKLTKLKSNTKVLETASERYYIEHQDWPRLSNIPYTSEQITTFAQEITDKTGQVVTLDATGNYYDIDYSKLQQYANKQSDNIHYILQNPVGEVYYLKNLTKAGEDRVTTPKLVSGSYIPEQSKEISESKTSTSNNLSSSIPYSDADGYVGVLNGENVTTETTQTGGYYTASDTKSVTGQPSANYNIGSYLGTLTQYLLSGNYTASDTKSASASSSTYPSSGSVPSKYSYNSGGYIGSLSGTGIVSTITGYYRETKTVTYSPGGNWWIAGAGWPSTMSGDGYDEYGIYWRGTLYYSGYTVTSSGGQWGEYGYPNYTGTITSQSSTAIYSYSQNYSGTVTKPAIDTRVYAYSGTVTKPEVDTRTYKTDYTQIYSGTVTKPAIDTRIWE